VPHDDLFPIELLRLQAQESILAEFGGRRPTMSEVARIPDDHLMKLSGFGPSKRLTVSRERSKIRAVGANKQGRYVFLVHSRTFVVCWISDTSEIKSAD